ncbi:MAG: hypothetical protein WCA78_04990 [Rhizomicrobium sp.]|jgi:hypothetical protein
MPKSTKKPTVAEELLRFRPIPHGDPPFWDLLRDLDQARRLEIAKLVLQTQQEYLAVQKKAIDAHLAILKGTGR